MSERIDCGGQLIVGGAVLLTSRISIADICANSNTSLLFDADNSGDSFAGVLFLGNGVTYGSTVTFNGPISLGATIDLNSAGARGTLACFNQSSAMIINGGAIIWPGSVTLAAGNGNAFSGMAEFEWVSAGLIRMAAGADLDGSISITGDMVLPPSEIRVEGDLTSNAVISVAGTTSESLIVVEGNVTGGDIDIADMRGSVVVLGSVASAASLIHIGNMNNGGPGFPSVVSVLGDFAGRLELGTGINLGQTVRILGEFLAGATIDLSNQNVAGLLEITGGGGGDIINGGAINGTVILADGPTATHTYAGSANFASVSSPGAQIKTLNGASLDGSINVAESGTAYAQITIAGSIGSNGSVSIGGDLWGAIVVGGAVPAEMAGVISIGGNFKWPSDIVIGGALPADTTGDIEFVGEMRGDIVLNGSLSGSIEMSGGQTLGSDLDVYGKLESTGRIMIDGPYAGEIRIHEETVALSQIVLAEGLDYGTIEINKGQGPFNANGTIHVGPTLTPVALPFDGCIRIYDDGAGSGGVLNGDIDIISCHDPLGEELVICIDGAVHGNVNLVQTGCPGIPATWGCEDPPDCP